MKPEDRLKTYQGFAETSRKWVSVYDTKAGFVSAMNAAVLTFIWTGAKLSAETGASKYAALAATILSIISLTLALWIVLPRTKLSTIFGKETSYQPHYAPISFFAHVASVNNNLELIHPSAPHQLKTDPLGLVPAPFWLGCFELASAVGQLLRLKRILPSGGHSAKVTGDVNLTG